LVQYDELDAVFTQFVLNSNVGGKMKSFLWLESYKTWIYKFPSTPLVHLFFVQILQSGWAASSVHLRSGLVWCWIRLSIRHKGRYWRTLKRHYLTFAATFSPDSVLCFW
jgi:hypothetical protein